MNTNFKNRTIATTAGTVGNKMSKKNTFSGISKLLVLALVVFLTSPMTITVSANELPQEKDVQQTSGVSGMMGIRNFPISNDAMLTSVVNKTNETDETQRKTAAVSTEEEAIAIATAMSDRVKSLSNNNTIEENVDLPLPSSNANNLLDMMEGSTTPAPDTILNTDIVNEHMDFIKNNQLQQGEVTMLKPDHECPTEGVCVTCKALTLVK